MTEIIGVDGVHRRRRFCQLLEIQNPDRSSGQIGHQDDRDAVADIMSLEVVGNEIGHGSPMSARVAHRIDLSTGDVRFGLDVRAPDVPSQGKASAIIPGRADGRISAFCGTHQICQSSWSPIRGGQRFVGQARAGQGRIGGMRLGIAHHFGWAVAVTASADHRVVDRRRIELIEPGMPTAPIHHDGKPLDAAATAVLVAQVRASAIRATSASLDELATALPEPIVSMSLRAWPLDFPDDIAVQRRAPYESHADSIMYRQVLAEIARARGWDVHLYDAKNVEGQAVSILAGRADEVLLGPRATLGPPWAKDHRMALAATIVAG